jgi:hypothetical protein
MTYRPISPILLGIFFSLAAVICALAGLSLLLPNSFLKGIWTFQSEKRAALLAVAPWSAIGLLALVPVMALAAKGTYQRRHWGWFLAISIFSLNGANDLARFVGGSPVEGGIGIIAVSIVLFWLTRPTIKAQFRL